MAHSAAHAPQAAGGAGRPEGQGHSSLAGGCCRGGPPGGAGGHQHLPHLPGRVHSTHCDCLWALLLQVSIECKARAIRRYSNTRMDVSELITSRLRHMSPKNSPYAIYLQNASLSDFLTAALAYMSWLREGNLGECPAPSAEHSCTLEICTMLSLKKKLRRHSRQAACKEIMAPK